MAINFPIWLHEIWTLAQVITGRIHRHVPAFATWFFRSLHLSVNARQFPEMFARLVSHAFTFVCIETCCSVGITCVRHHHLPCGSISDTIMTLSNLCGRLHFPRCSLDDIAFPLVGNCRQCRQCEASPPPSCPSRWRCPLLGSAIGRSAS